MTCNEIRNDFIKRYWRYYHALESDCLSLRRFVTFSSDNFNTFSDEIMRQFLSAGAEFDNLCRYICGLENTEETHISDYAEWFFDQNNFNPSIRHAEVQLLGENFSIRPFESWNVTHPDELDWWKSYNDVKHDRGKNYKLGNLDNLLKALSAIYFLQCYQFRKIAQPEVNNEEHPVPDVPPKGSELFSIPGFKTKFNLTDYDGLYAILE